eukprot:TRINITY_DN6992_c0_g1_i13.p1 TRINITY_DN6992_c0_g1~~TRINITY_DN6992_c0_g1_i13.p1  ORF type:complete len:351 (-),score=50.86 TRINITY_DN6992_c0_g1_i13:390-1409(-)
MVLKINGREVESFENLQTLLSAFPELERESIAWRDREIKTVYRHDKYVYIGQREMGLLYENDEKIEIIGSEDATTCHIIILKEHSTSTWGVIHIDTERENQLKKMMTTLIADRNLGTGDQLGCDVYIIGGYNDERSTSAGITNVIMKYMISESDITFDLKIVCAGDINTKTMSRPRRLDYPAPIHYGAAVNARTGQVFPAKFDVHGPDKDIRGLKHFLSLIYSSKTGKVTIPAFEYDVISSAHLWLEQSDEFILEHMSTSPKVEPEHFCNDMRNTFKRMITDPEPLKTVFKNSQDRVYRLNDDTGEWELENADLFETSERANQSHTTFTVKDFIHSVKK